MACLDTVSKLPVLRRCHLPIVGDTSPSHYLVSVLVPTNASAHSFYPFQLGVSGDSVRCLGSLRLRLPDYRVTARATS
jgi:hypothetical protein